MTPPALKIVGQGQPASALDLARQAQDTARAHALTALAEALAELKQAAQHAEDVGALQDIAPGIQAALRKVSSDVRQGLVLVESIRGRR